MNNCNNTMSYNLQDYVYKIDDFLDQSTCKNIIKKINKLDWSMHSYYSAKTNTVHSFDNELSILSTDIIEVKNLNDKLKYAIDMYINKLNFDWFGSYTGYTYVRLNKYIKDTTMKLHCDHIQSIFDGSKKGIPTLTILGSLNNDYKGGELILFKDKKIDLKAGNVVVFPSNFLYPHEVKPVISGVRYSYVSWVW